MTNLRREAIYDYAVKYHGDWKKIGEALRTHEPFEHRPTCSYITILDPAYPPCFKELRYPPWILFYKGDLSLLNKKGIGVVGSRRCTNQALKNTQVIVDRIKNRVVIVSGLAKGIDAMAHKSSLDTGTIGILGCGIDRIYPAENSGLFQQMKEHHLILSEYPGLTPPLARHFPWRNRLIAACSDSLIVIQSTFKSGTMITVNECLQLSRPVYCVPSAFEESMYRGCNYLIQNGAQMIVELEDLDTI